LLLIICLNISSGKHEMMAHQIGQARHP